LNEPVTCDNVKFLLSWEAVNCNSDAVWNCIDSVVWYNLANWLLLPAINVVIVVEFENMIEVGSVKQKIF